MGAPGSMPWLNACKREKREYREVSGGGIIIAALGFMPWLYALGFMPIGVRRGSIRIATPGFMPCLYAHGKDNKTERRRSRKESKVGDTFWVSPSVLREDRMTCPCVTMQARVRISVHGKLVPRADNTVSPYFEGAESISGLDLTPFQERE